MYPKESICRYNKSLYLLHLVYQTFSSPNVGFSSPNIYQMSHSILDAKNKNMSKG